MPMPNPEPKQPDDPSWFNDLFGFDEPMDNWEITVKNFEMRNDMLICKKKVNTQFYVGSFECLSVSELNQRILSELDKGGPSSLGTLSFNHDAKPTGIYPLHFDTNNNGAVFQAASQFNCLEMASREVTPEAGIAIYVDDKTQGPACALACPAGTVYRNYFVKHNDGTTDIHGTSTGQNIKQLDNMKQVGGFLNNSKHQYWTMSNGYLIAENKASMAELNSRLNTFSPAIQDLVCVGVHWNTSVAHPSKNRVCQVYASAIPCKYSANPPPYMPTTDEWYQFANMALNAAYEATLAVATILSLKEKKRIKCYLTTIGGGAFGNEDSWISSAIKQALDKFINYPIDVVLIHHGGYAIHFISELHSIVAKASPIVAKASPIVAADKAAEAALAKAAADKAAEAEAEAALAKAAELAAEAALTKAREDKAADAEVEAATVKVLEARRARKVALEKVALAKAVDKSAEAARTKAEAEAAELAAKASPIAAAEKAAEEKAAAEKAAEEKAAAEKAAAEKAGAKAGAKATLPHLPLDSDKRLNTLLSVGTCLLRSLFNISLTSEIKELQLSDLIELLSHLDKLPSLRNTTVREALRKIDIIINANINNATELQHLLFSEHNINITKNSMFKIIDTETQSTSIAPPPISQEDLLNLLNKIEKLPIFINKKDVKKILLQIDKTIDTDDEKQLLAYYFNIVSTDSMVSINMP